MIPLDSIQMMALKKSFWEMVFPYLLTRVGKFQFLALPTAPSNHLGKLFEPAVIPFFPAEGGGRSSGAILGELDD